MRTIKLTLMALVPVLTLATNAMAADGSDSALGKAAVALAIGLAAFGGTMGQGKVASTALDGISRNPGASGQMQTPLILGLAFVESLVIFTWLMIFLLS